MAVWCGSRWVQVATECRHTLRRGAAGGGKAGEEETQAGKQGARWSRQDLSVTVDSSGKRAFSFFRSSDSNSWRSDEDAFFLIRRYCKARALLGASFGSYSSEGGKEESKEKVARDRETAAVAKAKARETAAVAKANARETAPWPGRRPMPGRWNRMRGGKISSETIRVWRASCRGLSFLGHTSHGRHAVGAGTAGICRQD